MYTTTGDSGGAILFLLFWIALMAALSIFVIRMGVLSVARELQALNKEVAYLNRLLHSRMNLPPGQ